MGSLAASQVVWQLGECAAAAAGSAVAADGLPLRRWLASGRSGSDPEIRTKK